MDATFRKLRKEIEFKIHLWQSQDLLQEVQQNLQITLQEVIDMIDTWSNAIQEETTRSNTIQEETMWSNAIQEDLMQSNAIQEDPMWSNAIQEDLMRSNTI